MRTCADEEHVVRSQVQGVDAVHRQPGEVDALGEQQGASQSLVLHQRVLLGKVERGVGQLQRAVVAAVPVGVGDTLRRRQRMVEEEREQEGHEEEEEEGRRRKRLSCSWHRLKRTLGFETAALSSLSSILLSLLHSSPPATTPLPLLPLLEHYDHFLETSGRTATLLARICKELHYFGATFELCSPK